MHTLKIILVGLLLFAVMVAIGWMLGGSTGLTYAFYGFVPLWLVCAVANLRIGVARAGYSVREELPIMFVVFLVPVAIAGVIWMLIK